MTIQRLVPKHATEYRAMMLEAYELHPDAFTSSATERGALPFSWWESRLREEPDAPELVFGAFSEGQLAGAAGLSFETREKARHKGTIFGMYVPTRFRRRGFGRRLVDTALAHAGAHPGAKVVQLTVTEGNRAARTLYEQCGFVAFGVEPFAVAVGPDFVAKVHMWRRVDGSLYGEMGSA